MSSASGARMALVATEQRPRWAEHRPLVGVPGGSRSGARGSLTASTFPTSEKKYKKKKNIKIIPIGRDDKNMPHYFLLESLFILKFESLLWKNIFQWFFIFLQIYSEYSLFWFLWFLPVLIFSFLSHESLVHPTWRSVLLEGPNLAPGLFAEVLLCGKNGYYQGRFFFCFTCCPDAAQTLAIAQDQNLDIPSQDQLKQISEESPSSRKSTGEGNIPTVPTSQYKCTNSREDEDLIENLTQAETSRLDLELEEWDVAGLPWWFLGNLRNSYTPRSNDSTDKQTNQDIGTAIVSDTTDDVWFLNESVPEQFGVERKVEAADAEQTSEEVGKVRDKMVIEAGKNDDLEDSKSICDDTDTEVASEDEWQCTECKKFNSPSKRYCFRCWALRKGWYSDCPKLTHSLSTSAITAITEEKVNEGIDVPDCRRTISAPVVTPKDVYRKEENSKLFDPCNSVEFLDLAHSSESQETISSVEEQSANLFKQRSVVGNVEDCRSLLKPCSVCEKRPRDGNIIHGRTSHLVTCFHCARRLKKARASCPICKKEIQLVIKVFIA
ncbi:protein Mdm4 isoform X1 [Saccopteryx leptura]|uniref:protein Mdm4 isoform X1 n=1 Tax=Saccopteryx leptura TaxID=249018 RepID=UPI00339C34AB